MNHKLLVSIVKKRSNELETRSVNQVLELSEDPLESNRFQLMVALAKGYGESLNHRYVPP